MENDIDDILEVAEAMGITESCDLDVEKPEAYKEIVKIKFILEEGHVSVILDELNFTDPRLSDNGKGIILYHTLDSFYKSRIEFACADENLFSITLRVNTEPGSYDEWEARAWFLCRKNDQ